MISYGKEDRNRSQNAGGGGKAATRNTGHGEKLVTMFIYPKLIGGLTRGPEGGGGLRKGGDVFFFLLCGSVLVY